MRIPGLQADSSDPSIPWRETRHPGVRWVLLSKEGDFPGRGAAVLIRMEPGQGYPPHRHLDGEEVLVLEGGYRDEAGEYRAGDFVRYAAGSCHAPVALGDAGRPAGPEHPACLLFAVARGGIEPVGGVPETPGAG